MGISSEFAMTHSECKSFVKDCLKAGFSPFIWGPPGVGKTDMVSSLKTDADLLRGLKVDDKPLTEFPFCIVHAQEHEPIDLRGLPYTQAKESGAEKMTYWALPSWFPSSPYGILFLDDFTAAPQAVQSVLATLVLDRTIGGKRLPDGWKIIGAGNRKSDKASSHDMPSHLVSRWIHMTYMVDPEEWTRWAFENNMPESLIAFIRYRSNLLHDFKPSDIGKQDLPAYPCPRTWGMAGLLEKACPGSSIKVKHMTGFVGSGPASEYVAFQKVYQDMPDLDAIIDDPDEYPVPNPQTEISKLYAVTVGLSRRAKETNFAKIMKFVNRLPKEFQAFVIKDAYSSNRSMGKVPAFLKWAEENKVYL